MAIFLAFARTRRISGYLVRIAVFKVGDRDYRIEPRLDRCFDFVLVSHTTAVKQTRIDNKLTFATLPLKEI